MDLKLKGKTALVTGSTAGIGYSIAEVLAAEGAHVIVNGRTEKRVNEAIEKIKSKVPEANLSSVVSDLSNAEGAEKIIKSFPELDILVNNVGIFEPKAFEDILDEDWFKFFETNFMSGLRLSRHYLPKMKEKNNGRIVFISSESGYQIPAEMIHYGVTKTAQIALARGMAETTKGTAVTVNTVLPGPTMSEGVGQFVQDLSVSFNSTPEKVQEDFFKDARPTSIIQRFISTDEVANLTAFVCSPLASAINGAALRVEGGVLKSAF